MKRSVMNIFLRYALDIANIVDEKGEAGEEIIIPELGIGYRVLSSYFRQGVKEVIDLQGKYHEAVESKNLAEISVKEAHDFLEDVFGDREPYTINEDDKVRIRAFVKSIIDGWDKENGEQE